MTSSLPENAASSSNFLSDHITKFSERLAEAIPGLKRFTVGKMCYVCFDSMIVAKMNRDNDMLSKTALIKEIRKELFEYSNEFVGRFYASILWNSTFASSVK